MCLHRNLIKGGYKWNSKYFYWWAGFITSLSIFIEDRRRRVDLALYVLPKAAESWYKILYNKNRIFELDQYADVWFFSAATGVIMVSQGLIKLLGTAHSETGYLTFNFFLYYFF